ncbi:sulfotransferase domain-containing protein [Corallococcus llansteffanensis]|uniref:Sulfotransferase domain-containing protein n=1 Tax=Corallococcus llansteffanensis TaxID=2316731 RepID=A0A3A8QPE5_9BACT|nr:sulfotransferase domain-containing protein [Corallococcus llansteffanensis]RKH68750.1 sulfotransferase domain-containing protein [Corallococcus llansteffanensis]
MAPRPPTSRPVLRAVLNAAVAFFLMQRGLLLLLLDTFRWLRLRYVWLKPRPTDIYISTFPKAGTTWMQQIVYQLLTRGRGEYEHILQVAPFVDMLALMPNGERLLDGLAEPRILKTHLRYGALRPPRNSRIIYVTRAAADSILSRFHHNCLMHGSQLDFDGFFREQVGNNEWAKHLASWWPHRNDPNVLHIRYADLIADRETCLRRIGAFLGIPVADEDLPLLMEKTGFEHMKQNDFRFDPRLTIYEPLAPGRGFVFKGGVGRGKQALKPEQQARLDARVNTVRQKLGITDDAF